MTDNRKLKKKKHFFNMHKQADNAPDIKFLVKGRNYFPQF